MIELLEYAMARWHRTRIYCGTQHRHLFYSAFTVKISIENKMKALQDTACNMQGEKV